MISKIDKANISSLRAELETAIRNVCEKHGLRASSLGSISYTDSYFTTGKITVSVKRNEAPLSTVEPNSLVGQRYKMGQRTFTVTSSNGDGTVTARTNRGASYRIRIDQLESMIKL
jgi:hypothetical protein